MRKFLFIIIPLFLFSFDFKSQFLAKNYLTVCKTGMNHLNKIKNNEELLSLVGVACAKSDYLIYLPTLVNLLKKTEIGRKNGIYFAVLLLQKKLLYSYMMDNIDISYYQIPLTDHPLSIVVTAISNKEFEKRGDKLIIKYNNNNYKVYKEGDKVFIDIYNGDNLIESHWYR
jgi:hypothetical protein